MNVSKIYYKNENEIYELVVSKRKVTRGYVIGVNGSKIPLKNFQSTVMPTKLTIYLLLDDNKKSDVTLIIDDELKTKIFNRFWELEKEQKNLEP